MRKDKKVIFKRVVQVLFSSFVAVAIIGLLVFVTQGRDMPLLNTEGSIANQERDLILITFGLGLLVVVPVLFMLFMIAWKYRAGNAKAKYQPELEGHRGLELLWWGIPCLIILLLAYITVISTYALDPYKPLESKKDPIKIQVVAMEWKWLFIYPDNNVATLNYANVPEDTPIEFTITSDAPMNSFWVPALAGQVYAMSGMSTKLHVIADKVGSYNGSSANISGEGFANMRFKVNSLSESDYTRWLFEAANSKKALTHESYAELEKPSKDDGEITYMLMADDLYNEIVMKYMHAGEPEHSMHGMDM